MLFAKFRWTGKVLDGADIDRNSKIGRELSSTLITFSKYIQMKNRRGDGANRVRLDLSPAEWALLAAILAPTALECEITEHLSATLDLSDADVSSILERVRQSALKLAKQKMPNVVALMRRE